MREIKFRAWLKDENKMAKVHSIHLNKKRIMVTYRTAYGASGNYAVDDGDYVLQQYTGLKDKNGVEIYEGDLLWRPTVNRTIYLVDFNDENYGWLMGWNLLEYGIIDDKNNLLEFDKVQWSNNTDVVNYPAKSYYYGSSPNDRYEVVGNIFEGIDK